MSQSVDDTALHGRELFASGAYYCAESVLLALAEHFGVESAIIPQIATGFCSGMARTRGLCGAVTGAMMGVGLVNGRHESRDDRERNYAATGRFLAAFEARFGSLNCYDLTGCDLGTPDGQAKFRAEQMGDRCAGYVENAVRLALAAAGDDGES